MLLSETHTEQTAQGLRWEGRQMLGGWVTDVSTWPCCSENTLSETTLEPTTPRLCQEAAVWPKEAQGPNPKGVKDLENLKSEDSSGVREAWRGRAPELGLEGWSQLLDRLQFQGPHSGLSAVRDSYCRGEGKSIKPFNLSPLGHFL